MSSAKTYEAITYTAFGGVDVLQTVTKTVGKPADQEVVVRIHASGVNPLDVKLRGGAQNREIPSDGIVPHTDGAGTVIDIGAKVENFKIGDRVWGVGADLGTAAEIAYVPVERVTSLPDNADFELGASLGIPAITAALALNRLSGSDVDLAEKPYEGKTVLVRGGGAVGHFAIQLAKWAGARTVVTAQESKREALLAAGADVVVARGQSDYEQQLVDALPDGADVIVDVAPGANMESNLRVTAPQATISHYGREGGDEALMNFRVLQYRNIEIRGLRTVDLSQELRSIEARVVLKALADGALSIGEGSGLPVHVFDMGDIAEAPRQVESGEHGNTVVRTAS